MEDAHTEAIRELWALASEARGSMERGSFGLLIGSVLAEQHAIESNRVFPSQVDERLRHFAESAPQIVDSARRRLRSLGLNAEQRLDLLRWFLDHFQRDLRGGSEFISSPSIERLAVAALLSDVQSLPDRPMLWSPCSGSGRVITAVAKALTGIGLAPQLTMWDVNQSALSMSTIMAFLSDLSADVVERNCLTWNPIEEPMEANLAVADIPMGLSWDGLSGRIESLRSNGVYEWGLPRKSDATWLFQQVLVHGLCTTGKGIAFTATGPLRATDANTIREAVMQSDQLHSIGLLPSGTSAFAHFERAAVLWDRSKRPSRSERITIVNLRDLFEEAPKGSIVPRVLQEVAVAEFTKAIADPRPTRISRTLEPDELTFNILSTHYPLLEDGRHEAASTHQVPVKRPVNEWFRSRYGDRADVFTSVTRQGFIDFSGYQVFLINDSSPISHESDRLACLITALRIPVRSQQSSAIRNQYGEERDEPWLVVRGGKVFYEEDPPLVSQGAGRSQAGHKAWQYAFQVHPKLDPLFLHEYLASPSGGFHLRRDGRRSPLALGIKPVLSVLDDIVVPCPDSSKQAEVIGMLEKLRMVSVRLTTDRESAWDGSLSHVDLNARAETYLGSEDMKTRLRAWPNPVASAAWMVVISETIPESQEKALVRFWEAVSGFQATLMLSVIKGIPDLEQPILSDIRSGISKSGNLNLREASTGCFALIASTCANRIRSRIHKAATEAETSSSSGSRTPDPGGDDSGARAELEQVHAAFGGLRWDLIQRLVSKDFTRLFERLRPLRTPGAHGGAETRSQLQRRIQEMHDLVREWDVLTRSVWPEFQLVRGGPSERLDSHCEQEVEFIVGNDYPFARGKVQTTEAMKSGVLYMYSPSSWYFMELRAPLFDFMEVPEEAKLACYYFNRLRGDDIDLKSFVYPAELTGSLAAPRIGETVQWLVGNTN